MEQAACRLQISLPSTDDDVARVVEDIPATSKVALAGPCQGGPGSPGKAPGVRRPATQRQRSTPLDQPS